ncbi:MAG TPA: hypothetical protein VFC82_12040 [Actinomycetaceae bacterium]|nr:hypothetical protein [Actinomycetaceae bacterium]
MAPSAIESVDEPDLLVRQFNRLSWALMALPAAVAAAVALNGPWQVAIGIALLAIPGLVMGRRLTPAIPTTVRLDKEGIHRKGRFGLSIPWSEIEYAAVHPYDKQQVLVVVPHNQVKHWSRTWRNKPQDLNEDLGGLPTGGYILPIFDQLAVEIERYIAGHLPGHPGFDPSRIRLSDATREVLDEEKAAARKSKKRATAGPVVTTMTDRLARREMLTNLGLAIIAIAFTVWIYFQDSIPATVAMGLVSAFLLYRTWNSFKARQSIVLVAELGIQRAGPWGWSLRWKEIKSASVESYQENDYLVVVRMDENAMYHRSATQLRGHPFQANALISPIPADQRDAVTAALVAFRRRR